jgi:very-short-patch-repair endonuclease
VRIQAPPLAAPGPELLTASNLLGLTSPLDILVNNDRARKASEHFVSHTCKGPFGRGCFVSVSDDLVVCSPELTFLLMAKDLSLHALIELGYELCGTYDVARRSVVTEEGIAEGSPGIRSCDPLTTVAKLRLFVAQKAGLNGHQKAVRALRYIADNSASPMETVLNMMLTLPYALGGYGLRMPILNHRIDVSDRAKKAASKTFYVCDLYWPDANVAVEYDSDAFHTGAQRIANDSKRRNALIFMGVQVVVVTRQQIYNSVEFNKVVRLLAKNLSKQLRYKNPGFANKHLELRKLLP